MNDEKRTNAPETVKDGGVEGNNCDKNGVVLEKFSLNLLQNMRFCAILLC